MDEDDRKVFHEFLFVGGAYLTPQRWPEQCVPIAIAESKAIEHWRYLKIFKEDLFAQSNLRDPSWVTWHTPTRTFYVHGPGIEYLVSYQDHKGIHQGRLYMGLVSPSSFIKPKENAAGAHKEFSSRYKALENLYKSCARYLRDNYRKDDAGFYHGKGSDTAVSTADVAKVQM